MNKSLVQVHHHGACTHHITHITDTSTKSSLDTQSLDLSKGQVPPPGARKLKAQTTRDE